MRRSPEIERLEARQLPNASLSAASLRVVASPPDEVPVSADSRSPVLQSDAVDQTLPQQETQPSVVDSGSQVASPLAALWPTASWSDNGVGGQGQTANPSASPAAANNATSLPEPKGDSAGFNYNLVALPVPGAANESLPPLQANSTYPVVKQPRGFLAGERGRLPSEELPFHEDATTVVVPKQREASYPSERNRLTSEAGSAAQWKAAGLFSRPRREPSLSTLDVVFSSLPSALPRDVLGSYLGKRNGLDTRGVTEFFSSLRSGAQRGVLPAGEAGPLPRRVQELLATLAGVLPGLEQTLLRRARPDEEQPAEGDEWLPVPPLYLSVLLYRQPGKPLDPSAQQGLDRLCAYAWSSIHNAEKAHGERFRSPEDIVQEIYLEWRGLVGPRPEAEALTRLLQDDSEEMRLLRVAVQRVIGRTRYQQRQWAKGGGLSEPACSSDAFVRRGGQERIDWEDLWENIVSTLAPHEKQVLELRKQEKTFAEIGSELGMPRQRTCEIYHSVVARLQKRYPEW